MAKEDERKESESLPLSVTEFLDTLLNKMRYRRKVRQDVRAELAAHFEDELKGCAMDEEKQKKTEQLISNFGDLRLLAVLIRRAKKRCRPLWRTVVARTFQIIGVLLLCLIMYTVWFSCGEPTIRVDYMAMLNRMNQPEVLERDNAWPNYEKAISLFVPQSTTIEKFISYRRKGKDREEALRLKKLLNDSQSEISQWLAQKQKYWDSLDSEKRVVIQKCFEYDWVPLPRVANDMYTEWETTTFDWMTEHILKCIETDTEPTMPHPRGPLPLSEGAGFPSAELKSWLENRQIPANFARAVSVGVIHEAQRRYKDLPDDISAPLSAVEQEYIGAWVRQNEAAWREFAAGSSKSYCYRPYTIDPNDEEASLLSILLPHTRSLRYLAMLGKWRCRIETEQGRIQESIDDCITITRAGSHWQGKGSIVEQLVGIAIGALARNEIMRLLDTKKLSATELSGLQDQLSQTYPDGYPLVNMESEKLVFMDVVQRSFTDGGPGGGHLIPGRLNALTDIPASIEQYIIPFYTAASMVHAGRDATEAKGEELYDLQSKLAKMTPHHRDVCDIKMPEDILFSMPRHRYFLIQTLMPASARVSEIAYRSKMHHEAALTVLALKRWRLEKNEYPASLNELLSADFLKELPLDPYSDKPLVYKRTDGDSILYSVGPNFKDDDGQVAMVRGRPARWGTREAGDIILWPVPEQ